MIKRKNERMRNTEANQREEDNKKNHSQNNIFFYS